MNFFDFTDQIALSQIALSEVYFEAPHLTDILHKAAFVLSHLPMPTGDKSAPDDVVTVLMKAEEH